VDTNPFKFSNYTTLNASNDTTVANNSDSAAVFVIGAPDTVAYFRFNHADLDSTYLPWLRAWAKYIRNYPQIRICIEGHTDAIGSDRSNMRLSRRRARWVKDWLLRWLQSEAGIPATEVHIATVGYGESRPVATNRTPEGRQKNRRVVIRLGTCQK